jgi:hypothetical protein
MQAIKPARMTPIERPIEWPTERWVFCFKQIKPKGFFERTATHTASIPFCIL